MAGRVDCLKLTRVSEDTASQGSKFQTLTVQSERRNNYKLS